MKSCRRGAGNLLRLTLRFAHTREIVNARERERERERIKYHYCALCIDHDDRAPLLRCREDEASPRSLLRYVRHEESSSCLASSFLSARGGAALVNVSIRKLLDYSVRTSALLVRHYFAFQLKNSYHPVRVWSRCDGDLCEMHEFHL